METIRETPEELKVENKSPSDEELNHILKQIMEKSDASNLSMQKIEALQDNMIDRVKSKQGHLPEKYFMERNSLLTDLVELPHFDTIRNFCIAIWLTLFANAVVTDFVKSGKISLGVHQLPVALTSCHTAILIWICMFTSTVAVYYAFSFWAALRVNIRPKSLMLRLWNTLWLLLFVIYCCCFFYFSVKSLIHSSLQIMISTTIIEETMRLFMKTYAFVRSNTPRALNYKLHDEDKVLCPEFSKFLYFSFAPTLIYRDNYPRTSHIRWNYLAVSAVEYIAAFLCMHFIQEYVVESSFNDYDLKNLTWQDVIFLMSRNVLPNFLYWICLWFVVFHVEQNSFAEILRFADRLFYKDWWNSNSAEQLYAKFSVAVHDWLYIYIYKDIYEIVLPKNEIVAKTVEIVLLAVFHEFLFSFPYRFYYTIMIVFYAIALPLLHFARPRNNFLVNICFLYGIMVGVTILRTGLTLEYYVRLSCPVENATLLSYFIPRTFTCNSYKNN